MNKGRGGKAPVRDWLDRSEKPPSSQKGKPTATVKPVQASIPNGNYNAFQSVFNMLCQSSTAPTPLRAQSSYPQLNKANHQPPQSSSVKPAAGPQKTNHRPHVPTSSGVKGNVAKNNAVQLNINVNNNHYHGNSQKKPTTPVGNAPKPNVARKHHAPASSGVNKNVASQNAVQLNVNVSSNVKNTRPRSNNAQHVPNSAKPKLQCTPGTSHAPANHNKSSNYSGGPRRNANSNKNNSTTIIVIHKN